MANPVVVVDYDPDWAQRFEFLRGRITVALGGLAAAVEHVGSTAVVGLAAKPIIDMDVLLISATALPEAIERLAALGYAHQGDLGIPERRGLSRAPPGDFSASPLRLPATAAASFSRHLAFRDYLRSHPQEAKAYGDLKQALAVRFVARPGRPMLRARQHVLADLLRRAHSSRSERVSLRSLRRFRRATRRAVPIPAHRPAGPRFPILPSAERSIASQLARNTSNVVEVGVCLFHSFIMHPAERWPKYYKAVPAPPIGG